MATEGVPVFGGTVKWGTDGTTFAAIPGVKNIVVPTVSRDYNDRTSLDSTGGFKEYSPGLKDGGEITVECFYTPDLYSDALAKQNGDAVIYFEVTLPAGAGQAAGDEFVYTGYVTVEVPSAEVGADMMLNINVRTTGAPYYTKGAAA